jgi:predicted RNA-binding protein (virulence factor B family)
VREDKKLDISLQPIGKEKSNDRNIEKILEVLKISGNIIEITKKSNPEDIQNIFGISKKAFKRALVTLQERDKVAVNENKITLL